MSAYRIVLCSLLIGILHAESAVVELWKRWKDQGQIPSSAEIERASHGINAAEAIDLRAWTASLAQDSRSLLTWGDAVLARNRERLAASPLATLLYVEALREAGRAEEARHLLQMIPARDALLRAAMATASAMLADGTSARADLVSARRLLAQAVPEVAYESWQSREILRVLDRIEAQERRARELSELGVDFLAWHAADRLAAADPKKGLVALLAIPDQDPAPHPRIAAAARIEAARLFGKEQRWQEARVILKPLLQPGAVLGSLAWQCAGDLAAMSGAGVDPTMRAWKAAYDALPAVGSPATPDVTPAALSRLLPPTPLQRMDAWGCPAWAVRGTGHILDPTLAEWVAAHTRYQITLRLAIGHAATGDRRTAVNLARSLLLLSPIDRALADRQEGAGSAILAASLESGTFPVPTEGWNALPPADRLCALLALGCYQIYDWESSRRWCESALERTPGQARQFTMSLRLLHAKCVQMLGDRRRAEAMLAEIVLIPGERPTQAWFKAQEARFQLAMGDATRREDALRILQAIRDRAAGTDFARDALLHQAQFCMGFDRTLARRLFLDFRQRYPGQFASAIDHWLAQLDSSKEVSP